MKPFYYMTTAICLLLSISSQSALAVEFPDGIDYLLTSLNDEVSFIMPLNKKFGKAIFTLNHFKTDQNSQPAVSYLTIWQQETVFNDPLDTFQSDNGPHGAGAFTSLRDASVQLIQPVGVNGMNADVTSQAYSLAFYFKTEEGCSKPNGTTTGRPLFATALNPQCESSTYYCDQVNTTHSKITFQGMSGPTAGGCSNNQMSTVIPVLPHGQYTLLVAHQIQGSCRYLFEGEIYSRECQSGANYGSRWNQLFLGAVNISNTLRLMESTERLNCLIGHNSYFVGNDQAADLRMQDITKFCQKTANTAFQFQWPDLSPLPYSDDKFYYWPLNSAYQSIAFQNLKTAVTFGNPFRGTKDSIDPKGGPDGSGSYVRKNMDEKSTRYMGFNQVSTNRATFAFVFKSKTACSTNGTTVGLITFSKVVGVLCENSTLDFHVYDKNARIGINTTGLAVRADKFYFVSIAIYETGEMKVYMQSLDDNSTMGDPKIFNIYETQDPFDSILLGYVTYGTSHPSKFYMNPGDELTCVIAYPSYNIDDKSKIEQLKQFCSSTAALEPISTSAPKTIKTIGAASVTTPAPTQAAGSAETLPADISVATTVKSGAVGNTLAPAQSATIQVVNQTPTFPTNGALQQDPVNLGSSDNLIERDALETSFKSAAAFLTTDDIRRMLASLDEKLKRLSEIQSLVPYLGPPTRQDVDSTANIMEKCSDFAAELSVPPTPNNDPLPIEIAFAIQSLDQVSNVDETIATNAVLVVSWKVETCPWQSSAATSKAAIREIKIPDPNAIWKPTLRFMNAARANVYQVRVNVGEDFVAAVDTQPIKQNRTYSFIWSREGAFDAECDLELEMFPFDKQTCSFSFSLTRSASLINFDADSAQFFVDQDAFAKTEWRLDWKDVGLGYAIAGGRQVGRASFVMQLSRDPTYYIENLVIPTVLVSCLCLPAFFMPPASQDRPMLTITVLLSLTVSQQQVMTFIPVKPETTLLSTFVRNQLLFAVGCLIYQLFANWLAESYFVEPRSAPPRLFRKQISLVRLFDLIALLAAVFGFLATILHFLAYGGIIAV